MSTTTLLFGAAALLGHFPVAAQAPAAPPTPGTGSGAPAYSSGFDGYRPFQAGEVQDWRKSNDTVRDIGGWRTYAREISGHAPAQGQREAPATAPAPAHRHEGHAK